MMERTAVDRRPGTNVPVKKNIRTFRFAHLARSGQVEQSLLASSSVAVAAVIAIAALNIFDSYFCDGFYFSAAWNVFQQIGRAFRF
jgi:hypothetical protein